MTRGVNGRHPWPNGRLASAKHQTHDCLALSKGGGAKVLSRRERGG